MGLSRFNLSIPLVFDKYSIFFSMVVMLISFRVMLFSSSYISGDKNLDYFTAVVVLFVFSINLLIFCPNLVSLLLG